MSRYVLTRAAVRDLDQIWDYTAETWSVKQAESYAGDLKAAC
jgi:toxin ParE1/3/4